MVQQGLILHQISGGINEQDLFLEARPNKFAETLSFMLELLEHCRFLCPFQIFFVNRSSKFAETLSFLLE